MLIKSICALYQRDLHVDSLHARFDPPSVVYGACVIRVVRLREMHTKRYYYERTSEPGIWGARGPEFKSRRPDQNPSNTYEEIVVPPVRLGVRLESERSPMPEQLAPADFFTGPLSS